MIGQFIGLMKNILQSTEPADCFKLQFKTLQILGLFKLSSSNILLNWLTIFPLFLMVKLCALSIGYLLADGISLEEKFQGSFTANTSLLCIVKLYYVRKYQVQLQNVVKRLKSTVNDLDQIETSILNREAIYPTCAGYLLLQFVIIVSCLIYAFFPVGKNNFHKPMPVFAWYPHYMSEGTPYKITYFLQVLSIICAGSIWVCADTINFGLLSHHYIMLKILKRRIASLGWSKIPSTNKQHAYNYTKLCECVQYHNEISRYQHETEQIYSNILFANSIFLYKKSPSYGAFVAQLAILGIIVSSLFVLSWISENISVTSDELLHEAATCNFIEMDFKTTKGLIIFMQRSSATTLIQVGGILKVTLNLKMFIKIIEFAYKCLAVLKTAI